MEYQRELALFGGDKQWDVSEWTSSDDRVRGGKSQSYMVRAGGENANVAIFKGELDIDTLGGAGFASQRTATETEIWDLSEYDGIRIVLRPLSSDRTIYTLVLKDTLLPPDPETGREQSTISYEVDFTIEAEENMDPTVIRVFDFENAFTANYRGKPVKDAKALKTEAIRRFSIMNRSHFGQQKGEFHLSMERITAVKISADDANIVRKIYAAPTVGSSREQPSTLAAPFLAQRTEHLDRSSRKQAAIMRASGVMAQPKYHTFPPPELDEGAATRRRRVIRDCCVLLSFVGLLCCVPLVFFCVHCLHEAFR